MDLSSHNNPNSILPPDVQNKGEMAHQSVDSSACAVTDRQMADQTVESIVCAVTDIALKSEDTATTDEILLVAALDFGTTYSGIAWSHTHEFEKYPLRISCLHWSSMLGPSQATYKTPTSLLLKSNGEMIAFGYEAEEQYAELADDNAQSGYCFFKHFKMLLYENEILRSDTVLVDDEGHPMQAKDIFAQSISYMKRRLLEDLKSRGNMIREENILWVITVPAIWNDGAKQFTREAAVKAGIPRKRMKLALEPEAASIYTMKVHSERSKDQLPQIGQGTKYIVLDLGGGTIDISLKEVTEDITIKEVHRASGGPWGGREVNIQFMKFLEELIGKDVIKELKTTHKASWLDLEREIELKKRNTKGDNNGRVLFQIPAELQEVYQSKTGKKLINAIGFETKYAGKVDVKRNCLRIDKSIIETFLKKCLDNIVKHTKSLLAKPEARDTKYLVLVGGFAESEFLKTEIPKALGNLQIYIPDDPWLAVMRGAVIFGQNPSVVKSRISKYTYGTAVIRYFIDEYDDPEQKINQDGNPYCKNVFNKLAEVGQSFEVGETAENEVYAHRADMTKMRIKVFKSNEANPRYVTDENCKQIGNMLLDMPGYGVERKVTVSLSFGEEEITCKGVNEATGESVHVRLNLLSND
ncbi:heat shock 70 kDa protein 12A-like isoform X1 [Ostrea edulis]|uniref:heat shock 70 kDa protein 12A-like isoform X1 n=2 Tax=Ostrea edulis TaxID=37623 RepID=UPI0024AFFE39|nr:heat shock 70 kDa protein 12A-like isoform X1 [Ostrea edulis]